MYYNPIKVIASVQGSGNANQSPIVSNLPPEYTENGGDISEGNLWWDPINEYLYMWINIDDGIGSDWIPIGGAGYIRELIEESSNNNIDD